MPSTRRPTGARPPAPERVLGDPLDGRLDLDDLDAPLDLEAIGDDHDEPYLSERLRDWAERAGILPWVRRHRVLLSAVAAVGVLAAVASGISYARRPVPLPAQPRIVLTATGADADQVQVDVTGDVRVLTLSLALTSAESKGVTMTLLGLTGPGLASDPGGIQEEVDPSQPDRILRTTGQLDCTDPTRFNAVLSATPDQYAVDVRRTSPGGDSRVDSVSLRGASRLDAVVKQQCVQVAADNQLVVQSVAVSPINADVGLDLEVVVKASAGKAWNIERVVADPGSAITSSDGPTFTSPDTPARLHAGLHPSDCGHPLRDLADGLPIQAAPAGSSIDGGAHTQVLLPLPAEARTRIVEALVGQCGTRPVTGSIDQVILHAGPTANTAGTLELRMRIEAPGAFVLPIDDTTSPGGRLTPFESPAALVDGVATPVITWDVPPCARLARTGLPELRVGAVVLDSAQNAIRRPYLLPLGGEELRTALTRLCGDPVATGVLTPTASPSA